MFKHKNNVIALLLLTSSSAYADFNYNNQPISPDCLADIVSISGEGQSTVDLATCSNAKAAAKVRFDRDVYTTKNTDASRIQPFSDYSIIGQDGNRFLIDFGQWTGGSGFFTSIIWVSKTDNKLELLKTFAGGDRCNGGTEKDGSWQYTVNLTSADLIDYAGISSINIKAYKDLDASAAGCVARAHYAFDPKKEKATFVFVSLDDEEQVNQSWSKQFTHQSCFDQILKGYHDKNITKLDMDDLKAFALKFQSECIKK